VSEKKSNKPQLVVNANIKKGLIFLFTELGNINSSRGLKRKQKKLENIYFGYTYFLMCAGLGDGRRGRGNNNTTQKKGTELGGLYTSNSKQTSHIFYHVAS